MRQASRRSVDWSVLGVTMLGMVAGGSVGCLADAGMEVRGTAVDEECGDGDGDGDGDVDADSDVDGDADGDPEPGQVRVRVVHASSDAPAVDVYAAGIAIPLIEDLAYTETSGFLSVPPGTYDFEVRAAGAPPEDPPVYSTGLLDLPGDATVTAIAAGLLGSADEASRFRVLPIVEDFADAGDGAAIVRIVHACADAPAVAIDVGDDGSAEIGGLARFADTGAAGVALPAGTSLQVGILADQPRARVTAFTTPALPAGAELLVIATGLLGREPREPDGFGLLAVGPDGTIGLIRQNPSVTVLHASPNAGPVDVETAGATLVSGLSIGELSAPIQVPPGRYPLAVHRLEDGTQLGETETKEVFAGERVLAVATGFFDAGDDEESFRILAFAEGFATDDPASARVRAVHASPDAPAVDIGLVAQGRIVDPPLVAGLTFENATDPEGLSVPPVALAVGVAAAGSADPIAVFDIAPAAGTRAFALAAGALSPAFDDEAFRLLVVDTSVFPWAVGTVRPR